MSFLETPRFPMAVAWGSSSAPMYNNVIIQLRSGHEVSNSLWTYPLHRYNVAPGVRGESELYDLIEFFHSVQGRRHRFRFKDRWDYKSVFFRNTVTALDQVLGSVASGSYQFQLLKTYIKGALSRTRIITKPISGTVRVAVDGVEKTEGVDWTVDTTTGIVSFLSASVPADGSAITAGFEFDVPCRFESDSLPTSLHTYKAGSVEVNLVEVRV